jgi:UDP-galactopyranose mutase
MFENMLDHPNIRVETGVNFFSHRRELERLARLVYAGRSTSSSTTASANLSIVH